MMGAQGEERTSVYREAVAGVTTFFTMAYIVVVNPKILSAEGTGMPFSGVLTATVLICFTMTLLNVASLVNLTKSFR
jgi:AGZA family xanthine/uracil permease-like MFS transporter